MIVLLDETHTITPQLFPTIDGSSLLMAIAHQACQNCQTCQYEALDLQNRRYHQGSLQLGRPHLSLTLLEAMSFTTRPGHAGVPLFIGTGYKTDV